MPLTMNREVFITCAVTGAAHTPTMSEFLPITPDEIAAQAIDAVRAAPERFQVAPAWMAELNKVSEGQSHTLGAYHRPWK